MTVLAEHAWLNEQPQAAILRAGWRARLRDEGRWETAFRSLMLTALDRRVPQDALVKECQRAWRAERTTEKGAVSDAIRGMVDRVVGWLRSRVAEEQFVTGAQAMYLGLALDTGEDAGQYTLDSLGLNRTFAWASQRDFVRDQFAMRGSKIIQHLYGEHIEQLARIAVQATDPARPGGVKEALARIEEEWPALTRYEAARVARTEVATIWERTNWYALRANGVQRVKWLIATGPAIGRRTGPVCEECKRAAGVYVMADLVDIPPLHPHCRCTLVADIDPTWLPPQNPWTGSESPIPLGGFDDPAGGPVPRDVEVMKGATFLGPPGVEPTPEAESLSVPTLKAEVLRLIAEAREEDPDFPDDASYSGWDGALDSLQAGIESLPEAVVTKAAHGWDSGLHPRGWHGKFALAGRSKPHPAERQTLPRLPFQEPPKPRGVVGGRKAGGFAANGRTATSVGDLGESIIRQLGLHSLLVGQRQGPLDAALDHSWGFEVKTVTTHAREYKVAMKTREVGEKRDAAEKAGIRGALMMVVLDPEAGTAHVYWREGIKNGRLNEDWNFAGVLSADTGQEKL